MTDAAAGFSAFFNRLVDLIPQKYYRNDADERVDLQHMKKAERLAAKQDFKAKHKQNKKAKLAGQEGAEKGGSDGGAASDEEGAAGPASSSGKQGEAHAPLLNITSASASLSRPELQEKLQQKLLVRAVHACAEGTSWPLPSSSLAIHSTRTHPADSCMHACSHIH
jgi:hypothetical protein